MSTQPTLFLINRKAGGGSRKNIEQRIESIFKKVNTKYKIEYSEYAGHLSELAQSGIERGYKNIIVAGGDGSINEVFKAIEGHDVKLGIIPLGSGNGLARHLKIPLSIKKAIKVIAKNKSKTIDSAVINDMPYLSVAGTGFDALIARYFSDSNRRGFITYFGLTLKLFFTYKPYLYSITANDKKINTRALIIEFANSNQFGYNISVAPQAVIDDGYLDVCILEKPSIIALPLTAYYLLRGRIYKSKYCRFFRAKKIELESDNDLLVNVDGEFKKVGNQLKAKIRPKSIRIFVP